MKNFYVSPLISEEVMSSLISVNQYVDLGLITPTDGPAVCGAMGFADEVGNIAVFCSTSNEDHAGELNGVEVVGCNGTHTELTNCIVFDEDKTGGDCPGLVYICNISENLGDNPEAIASLGDSECPVCNDVETLQPAN